MLFRYNRMGNKLAVAEVIKTHKKYKAQNREQGVNEDPFFFREVFLYEYGDEDNSCFGPYEGRNKKQKHG